MFLSNLFIFRCSNVIIVATSLLDLKGTIFIYHIMLLVAFLFLRGIYQLETSWSFPEMVRTQLVKLTDYIRHSQKLTTFYLIKMVGI